MTVNDVTGPSTNGVARGQQYVVIGGGIAGVTCAQELQRLAPTSKINLISADSNFRGVGKVTRITKTVEDVEVMDQPAASLAVNNLEVIESQVASIDVTARMVYLANGEPVEYSRLCICAGARPKRVPGSESSRVLVLRDTDTVAELSRRLADARRIVVLGNGGIALQLVYALRGVEVVWVVKHGHIGDAFFDLDAAAFLLRELRQISTAERPHDNSVCSGPATAAPSSVTSSEQETTQFRREGALQLHINIAQINTPYSFSNSQGSSVRRWGRGVGPEWASQLAQARGGDAAARGGDAAAPLTLELNSTILDVVENSGRPGPPGHEWPIEVSLSNGQRHDADFVVCAIGVEPNTNWLPQELERSPVDGGLLVDEQMQTSVSDVYAAGDVCTARPEALAPDWFQMRLWTQARLMGMRAAIAMAGTEDNMGFSMELFTHATRFCGKKVVLLGLYNAQRLEDEPDEDIVTYTRASEEPGPDSTFVRVLLLRGRMRGAVLIGETELEDTFENLILDGLDLSCYGPALLDPNIELDHVFD